MDLITDGALTLRALTEADLPALQAFYNANPAYSLLTSGHAPLPTGAHEEFFAPPPPEFSHGRVWVVGFYDSANTLIGAAGIIEDLFAPGVWHTGIFIIATAQHGNGTAQHAYRLLETWMMNNGARWLRLGVVLGNARAERFWSRRGYQEVRRREGVKMGNRINTIRVMLKPLTNTSLANYLEKVPRDRPDT